MQGVDRRRAAEAALGLFVARYALRLLGFRRLVRTLGRGGGQRSAPDPGTIEQVAAAVDAMAEGRGYTCLPRAFAAAWMLRRRGWVPTLHYGVRRKDGAMQAHAWLDVRGVPVVGHEQAGAFTLLASFPPSSIASGNSGGD